MCILPEAAYLVEEDAFAIEVDLSQGPFVGEHGVGSPGFQTYPNEVCLERGRKMYLNVYLVFILL